MSQHADLVDKKDWEYEKSQNGQLSIVQRIVTQEVKRIEWIMERMTYDPEYETAQKDLDKKFWKKWSDAYDKMINEEEFV